MSEPAYTGGRLRAYLEFLAAILYFFLARSLASPRRAGTGRRCVVSAGRAGHAGLSAAARLRSDGFLVRPAGSTPSAHRVAAPVWLARARPDWAWQPGWAVALVCVLPMTVIGGIAISVSARVPPGAGS